ncbi:MAG: sulfate transporter CysZ [Gammaproteobacteria bacterium]|nr:sulfate transporter CysZ [Gammaproteobacteria bacterium]
MSQQMSVFYVLEGIKLLTKPGIKKFVIMPLVLNILLFGGLLLLSSHYYHLLSHWLTQHLPHWLAWLTWILWTLFFAGFFIVFIYAFTTLSNLIAAPFNSLLSEKVEFYLTGELQPNRSLSQNVADIPRVIGRQLGILGYYLPRAFILLVLFFVPVVQVVAAVFWFLFNAWFMTLQYVDYPADNHRVSLSAMRMKIKEKRLDSLGFGVGVLLLSMIPILNFLVMPAAIAGATKLWIDKLRNS